MSLPVKSTLQHMWPNLVMYHMNSQALGQSIERRQVPRPLWALVPLAWSGQTQAFGSQLARASPTQAQLLLAFQAQPTLAYMHLRYNLRHYLMTGTSTPWTWVQYMATPPYTTLPRQVWGMTISEGHPTPLPPPLRITWATTSLHQNLVHR